MSTKDTESSFKLAEGQGYMLDRNLAAAVRLNYQHYLWQDTLGYTLHPTIPTTPTPTAIAEVACGTGLWLLDLARKLPSSTQLDGYDIELINAPVRAWLPDNVSFKHWNVFDEVPTEMQGKYDVVHVRLLILVFDGEEKMPAVLQSLKKMLKPGGYLQWDEMDIANMSIRKPSTDLQMSTPGLDGLYEKCRAAGRFDWAIKLPGFVEKEGFEVVEMKKFGDRDDLVRAFNDQHMMTMQEFAVRLKSIGKEGAAQQFFRDIRVAYEESTKGAAMCLPRVVVVARKPA